MKLYLEMYVEAVGDTVVPADQIKQAVLDAFNDDRWRTAAGIETADGTIIMIMGAYEIEAGAIDTGP
jgi:hypothetical protein